MTNPRPVIDENTTLDEACNIVAEHLPFPLHMEIQLEDGAGSVMIYDEFGGHVPFPTNYGPISEQVEEAMSHVEETYTAQGQEKIAGGAGGDGAQEGREEGEEEVGACETVVTAKPQEEGRAPA